MELNEKLLEAHKKVVQLKLNKEVAKNFHGVNIFSLFFRGREQRPVSVLLVCFLFVMQHYII